ncbi:MAG: ribosome biogenesis GTPase A [Halieaceae bacterium]|jgi:ribosome biogenesis GTPase A
MQVQWYPGHMNRAAREIEAVLPQINVFLEILDARLPYSSQNPMLEEIRGTKPCLRVLNKSDLACPEATQQWLDYFSGDDQVDYIAVSRDDPAQITGVVDRCRTLARSGKIVGGDIFVLVSGIPNVGKSSIINTLAGRSVAKTGNEPAITRGQQRINLRNGVQLYDTPGVLWPNIEHPDHGQRLAVTGAIRDTAMDYQSAADFAATFLLENARDQLLERFQLEDIPNSEQELLQSIGRARNALRRGGVIDYEKVSQLLIHEIRDGLLGPLTWEHPGQIEKERLEVLALREAREAKKKARKTRYKSNRDA